jgi:transposase
MAKELVTDELWETIEPLLPPEPPKPQGGRPTIDDRAALTGIIFVLKSGIPWEMLPKEMGCGSGMSCWRRLKEWQEAGVWVELHRVLLNRLGEADQIDWERASLDSASIPAKRGGPKTGANPPDKGKAGSKRHLVSDRGGIPLAVVLSGANVHDSKVLEETVDAIEPIKRPRGRPGRPRKRPKKLHADKGYDFPRCRKALRKRGITPRIARRAIDSSERLGRHRWVVERTLGPGFRSTAGSRSAMSGATTSTRRSSILVAR